MYAQPNKKVTYLEDLPDLEDLESRQGIQGMQGIGNHTPFQSEIPEKFKKFIRNPMGPPHPNSGMAPYSPPYEPGNQQEFFPPQQETQKRPSHDSPTCLEIADHVGACPICSKFYKNENTVYIIVIVILAIICILLLKRVLDI